MGMTLAELRGMADEYFRRHLAGEEWKLLAEETKQSALAGAEADVALYLDRTDIDADEPLECRAVFEQAIHLARKARKAGGSRRKLISEEISGVGRRSWEYAGDDELPDYAPRALNCMDALKRRSFRISRG